MAIADNEDGFREVLGAAEGMKKDKSRWVSFFQWLRGHGLEQLCWRQVYGYAGSRRRGVP